MYCQKNPPSYDFGANLIIDRFGETVAVQVKCRKQVAGVSAVEEVQCGRDYYRTREAMVISLGGFTSSAVKMAACLRVELWDKKELLQQMTKS
jgi:restriction system protein